MMLIELIVENKLHGCTEGSSIGTGTAGLFGRATLVRPCKRTTWRQFYLTRNPLFGLARVARRNRPAAPVPMLHAQMTPRCVLHMVPSSLIRVAVAVFLNRDVNSVV